MPKLILMLSGPTSNKSTVIPTTTCNPNGSLKGLIWKTWIPKSLNLVENKPKSVESRWPANMLILCCALLCAGPCRHVTLCLGTIQANRELLSILNSGNTLNQLATLEVGWESPWRSSATLTFRSFSTLKHITFTKSSITRLDREF